MKHPAAPESCWRVTAERGFLMAADPLDDLDDAVDGPLRDALAEVLNAARALPRLLESGDLRARCRALPVPDLAGGERIAGEAAAERLHQAYAFLANAYLWAPGEEPSFTLPAPLARPFAELSLRVGRPPVLSYAATQLCNWRRRDPAGPLAADNLAPIQVFQELPDEAWFWIIHIAIEAAGGPAVVAGAAAVEAAEAEDAAALEAALADIGRGLTRITRLARRIEEGCSPDIFFRTLRPFLFSPPEGILFEGVERFGGEPVAFLGQTGAQSSLLPAICAALGIRHGKSDLTSYLAAVRDYMPAPHRAFVAGLKGEKVRDFVAARPERPSLREAYNGCIEGVIAFRRFHLTLAAKYIASKVEAPLGTGGTDFMRWLRHMTKETQAQFI